jgi:proline iminopeptidase
MGSGSNTPLVMLRSGPGGQSCGFSVLEDLAKERPVIIYDQLGSGRSERPSDPSLWRTDRFVDELAAVRNGLGLRRIHLLGHSWGAALAAEYLLTKRPDGVRSVIFSSPLLSTERWLADARRLRSTLSEPLQAVLSRCESVETADDEACKAANETFTERFVRGVKLHPICPPVRIEPQRSDSIVRCGRSRVHRDRFASRLRSDRTAWRIAFTGAVPCRPPR